MLQHQMPLAPAYALPTDGDCVDQCSSHPHHDHYANPAVVDSLHRDCSLTHQVPAPFTSYAQTHAVAGARYLPERPLGDSAGYQASGTFADSSSGSMSTSPSSAASSLPYTNFSANHYTGLHTLAGPVQQPQAFCPPSFHRPSALPDGSTQGMLPPPGRSTISGFPIATSRDTFPHPAPYLARSQLSTTPGCPGYSTYPETPRSALSATAGLSLSPRVSTYPAAHMAAAAATSVPHDYAAQSNECTDFPWSDLESTLEMTCDSRSVTPRIHANVEKNFFWSNTDKKWTCYRRNYFSVTCKFELYPNIADACITVRRNNTTEQVQALGMRLSAAVDGPEGKTIELIQHTPKRDAGPKTRIEIAKVAPIPVAGRPDQTVSPHGVYQMPMSTFHPTGHIPGPCLPLQHTPDSDTQTASDQVPQIANQYPYATSASHTHLPGQNTTHTFERIQFKQATANNGKRRASQQYFHLVVELFADVRKSGSDDANWVKVAQRASDKIVVRGRSPSHYQNERNEGPHGAAGRGGSAGGSSGYSTVGGASYSNMNTGGFRSLASSGYGGGAGGGGGSTYGNSGYGYAHPDHGSGQSDSGSSSVEGGAAVDADYPVDAVMSDADRIAIHEHDGYQYCPGAMYESVPNGAAGTHSLPPLAKMDSEARYPHEQQQRQYAVKAEYPGAIAGPQYQAGGCGRFQGFESSRGYYPDLQSSYS